MHTARRPYYFSTRDLVLISAVSAAGGVLSAYVGYLGNLVNRVLGVPFGAGQFMAGLHVFWFVLARAAVGRTGAGTLSGLIKGFIEFFAGSTHGLPVVLISLVEGLLVDAVLLPHNRNIPPIGAMCLAGGVAAASNVVVFQALYFSGVSAGYMVIMVAFSFISGALFGGVFTSGVLDAAGAAGVFKLPSGSSAHRPLRTRGSAAMVFSAVMALALAGGAVFYYASVHRPLASVPVVLIEGNVERPYGYNQAEFERECITVRAELVGQVTYVPPADYTGIPVRLALSKARPCDGATRLRAIASDGYEAVLELSDVMEDHELILFRDGPQYRVIAPGREGAYWVRKLVRLVVE